jgi:hypothetical protein
MPAKEFLPPEQKEKFWLSSGYRLTEDDLMHWEEAISGFEQKIGISNKKVSDQKSLHLG